MSNKSSSIVEVNNPFTVISPEKLDTQTADRLFVDLFSEFYENASGEIFNSEKETTPIRGTVLANNLLLSSCYLSR